VQWSDLRGHEKPRLHFQRALQAGRLANTYLLIGPEGSGKRLFARLLAKTLLCEQHPPEQWQPCGQCPGCILVEARTHPDLMEIERPPDRATIPLELLIGNRESRMQEGLCHQLSLRPARGSRKVAIIDDADHLSEEAANCLLKTLEEPPLDSLLLLLGTSEQRQLPTIRSRCQIIRGSSLSIADCATVLLQEGVITDPREAEQLSVFFEGDLARARFWQDVERRAQRDQLWQQFGSAVDIATLIEEVQGIVTQDADDAAAEKRVRLRAILQLAVERQRRDLRTSLDAGGDPKPLLDRLDRTLEALQQVDRNANLTALITAWAGHVRA
jgi:DNA polymerase-3 subunit delta'